MTATKGVSTEGVDDRTLERTREMFMQLLHTDRTAVHFSQLYEQVDEMLTSLMQELGIPIPAVADATGSDGSSDARAAEPTDGQESADARVAHESSS